MSFQTQVDSYLLLVVPILVALGTVVRTPLTHDLTADHELTSGALHFHSSRPHLAPSGRLSGSHGRGGSRRHRRRIPAALRAAGEVEGHVSRNGELVDEAVEDGGAHGLDGVDHVHAAVAEFDEVAAGVRLLQVAVEDAAVEEGPREAHLHRDRRAADVVRQQSQLDSLQTDYENTFIQQTI